MLLNFIFYDILPLLFNFTSLLVNYYDLHFTDEETRTPRVLITCTKSYRQLFPNKIRSQLSLVSPLNPKTKTSISFAG